MARSPRSLTCIAPRIDRLILPPRIIAKLSWLPKMLLPGMVVTVCLPALIRSGSTSLSSGKAPMPIMPFSLCSQTSMSGETKLATSVGKPMPRLT